MSEVNELAIPIGAVVRVKNPEDWVSAVSSKIRARDGVVRSYRRDGVFFVDFPAAGRRKLFTHLFRSNDLEVIAPSLGEGGYE